jgi:ribonuclease HI
MTPILYTDGSNSLKTGWCAWAVVVYYGDKIIKKRCGYEKGANGKAELRAVREALRLIPVGGCATIRSDAQYAIRAATEWRARWERAGFRTATGDPVKHLELVKDVHRLLDERPLVRLEHVKGHSGVEGNEAADQLAKSARFVAEGKIEAKELEGVLCDCD